MAHTNLSGVNRVSASIGTLTRAALIGILTRMTVLGVLIMVASLILLWLTRIEREDTVFIYGLVPSYGLQVI